MFEDFPACTDKPRSACVAFMMRQQRGLGSDPRPKSSAGSRLGPWAPTSTRQLFDFDRRFVALRSRTAGSGRPSRISTCPRHQDADPSPPFALPRSAEHLSRLQ
jgi:hypothetical protein